MPQKVSKQKCLETDYQKLAVEATERNVLVVAGAGTGKTKVIVDRVKHMFDNDYNASRMRVLTFTNAAAFEVGKESLIKFIVEMSSVQRLVHGAKNSLKIIPTINTKVIKSLIQTKRC